MKFGNHISKGVWAFADKGMPAVYGLAFMLIVIRTLSPDEYGTFFLFQTVFLLITSLATSFTVQPMVKYIAEGSDSGLNSSTALVMATSFIGICTGLLLAFSGPITLALDAQHARSLGDLFLFLPVLFVGTIYKMIASGVLQARLCMKQLFAIDGVYYLSSFVLISLANLSNTLTSAKSVVYIMIISSVLASAFSFFLARSIAIPTWRWNKTEASKILSYGKYSLGGTIGNVVQTQFDTLLISMFSGINGVALYGVAKNFTRVFDMFSQSIQMLIIPASSILHARNDRNAIVVLVEKSICFASFAILPPIIIYTLFPDKLLWLVYGEKYAQSAAILRVLALTGFIVPWGAVISSVLFGTGRTAIGFVMSIASLLLSLGVYYLAGSLAGLQGIVWGVVSVYVILGILGTLVLRHFVPFRIWSTLRRTKDVMEFVRTRSWTMKSLLGL